MAFSHQNNLKEVCPPVERKRALKFENNAATLIHLFIKHIYEHVEPILPLPAASLSNFKWKSLFLMIRCFGHFVRHFLQLNIPSPLSLPSSLFAR